MDTLTLRREGPELYGTGPFNSWELISQDGPLSTTPLRWPLRCFTGGMLGMNLKYYVRTPPPPPRFLMVWASRLPDTPAIDTGMSALKRTVHL